jgi:hypothetical protein
VYIKHRAQLCLNMSRLRLYALWKGDLSNTMVHPAMVHVADLFGFLLWQTQNAQFSLGTEEYLRLVAEEALAQLESTEDGRVQNCVATRLQVYCAHAGYHFYARRIDTCREYLSRALAVVNRIGTGTIVNQALGAHFEPDQKENGPHIEARNKEEGAIFHLMHLRTTVQNS